MNLTVHKNSTCYQLTAKTFNWEIGNETSDFRIKEATEGV